MDLLEIIKTIKEDWAVLMFFFSLGAAWWQGKEWFKKVNSTLDSVKKTVEDNSNGVAMLHQKMDHLHDRVGNLEKTTEQIDHELQKQEIKLAVIESTSPARRGAAIR